MKHVNLKKLFYLDKTIETSVRVIFCHIERSRDKRKLYREHIRRLKFLFSIVLLSKVEVHGFLTTIQNRTCLPNRQARIDEFSSKYGIMSNHCVNLIRLIA